MPRRRRRRRVHPPARAGAATEVWVRVRRIGRHRSKITAVARRCIRRGSGFRRRRQAEGPHFVQRRFEITAAARQRIRPGSGSRRGRRPMQLGGSVSRGPILKTGPTAERLRARARPRVTEALSIEREVAVGAERVSIGREAGLEFARPVAAIGGRSPAAATAHQ